MLPRYSGLENRLGPAREDMDPLPTASHRRPNCVSALSVAALSDGPSQARRHLDHDPTLHLPDADQGRVPLTER